MCGFRMHQELPERACAVPCESAVVKRGSTDPQVRRKLVALATGALGPGSFSRAIGATDSDVAAGVPYHSKAAGATGAGLGLKQPHGPQGVARV